MMRALIACLALMLTPAAFAAPSPDEAYADAAMERRARSLYTQLRCVVCQSQSIDESNASLAEDMRVVVRERLDAGDSDAEILAYMQARYGDYVLMLPPLQANTLVLWGLPIFILLAGGLLVFVFIRRQARALPVELTPEEEAELAALMEEEGQ
ncbi:cytochrome c-type biogenesis protein CcmH [Maricaulis sp.]|uniref:cytochrome c-type biogenesis protein n=1 Tax=Maricaulis sp. TaxID=1486257 RepID=UPI003A8E9140